MFLPTLRKQARTVATSDGTSSQKQNNVDERGPEHPTHGVGTEDSESASAAHLGTAAIIRSPPPYRDARR